MKPKAVIHFNSTIAHCSQIFTGLELLKEDGQIELEYEINYAEIPFNKMRVTYRGKEIIFDMADDYFLDYELLDRCDFYVKRMLLKSDFFQNEKLIPFGLNYSVMVPNSFFEKIWRKDPRLISYSFKYKFELSRLLGINDSIYNLHLTNMESDPKDNGKVIFGTRLWDPQNNEVDWKKQERKKLNNQRIAIIRKLRKAYGEDFLGGVEESELSQIICPDLLISKSESKKTNYLLNLKEGIIGIANYGLEGSIGWKFAEYITHGMAVVTTPIDAYLLHGNLEEGKNYLKFESVEDCIFAVDQLKGNYSYRKEIQKANASYYDQYLHPKRKMELILQMIEGKEIA